VIHRWHGQVVRQKPAKLPFPSSNLGATLLTIVATPIGNLGDISERARSALALCDLVLCEDTRHTGLLFQSLHIPPPRLLSLHRFNEASREDEIIAHLKEGKNIVLVSDAGLPCIADPGTALIARCHFEKIPVTAIPGPCAFATAYALSGALCNKMQFLGFLPKQKEELLATLHEMYQYPGASVVYESPHRVKETLAAAVSIDSAWEIVLVRELTKVFEEVVRLPAAGLAARLEDREVKGECSLVFLPAGSLPRPSNEQLLEEVASARSRFSCSLKEAVDMVSKNYRMSQRELYQVCIGKTE
jgi:16S rRNA (cytidine1402-2'-O)-methyltransferase